MFKGSNKTGNFILYMCVSLDDCIPWHMLDVFKFLSIILEIGTDLHGTKQFRFAIWSFYKLSFIELGSKWVIHKWRPILGGGKRSAKRGTPCYMYRTKGGGWDRKGIRRHL